MSESADRPQWIPVQNMVSPGSIGEELVSRIPDLGGRLRPETTFGQSLRRPSLFVQENPDLSTFGDILGLPAEKLATFSPRFRLQERLDRYLRGLLVLPQIRLLAAIYRLPQFPTPADREQEIVEGVESVLDQMPDKRMLTVIVLHFGLHDGITRSWEEIGRRPDVSVTRERVRQINEKGFRELRHSASGAGRYLVLSEDSFGRKVFGAVLRKDFPDLGGKESIEGLQLSSGALEELKGKFFLPARYIRISDLVESDLGGMNGGPVSDQAMDEISLALQRRVREVEDKRRRKVEQEAQAAEQKQEVIVELRNNLLPEIELSPQWLERVDKVLLTDLGLPTRWRNALKRQNGIITVGALLRLDRQDLRGIRNVGVKAEAEIVGKLTAFLKSQFIAS